MIVGVVKEVKPDEYRVGMVPACVESLVAEGHTVLVERSAGEGSGVSDADYQAVGARIEPTAKDVWAKADMVVKVKEPMPQEYASIRAGQVVFTYFHFAADEELTEAMLKSGAICVAYETVRAKDGSLPMLAPMSEIAGRMAVQEGAKFLERPAGGKGILLGGVPGVDPAKVLVLGGGTVGANAARVAAGMGANVVLMDINVNRLRYLDDVMPANVTTVYANAHNVRTHSVNADLVIGAVLKPGGRTPVLISRADLAKMKPGAVLVDVAIDQGGAFETSRPTTHTDPVYVEEGVLHYCVANIPGAVAYTSTYALTNATSPYVLALACKGWKQALIDDAGLRKGLNVANGKLYEKDVADLFNLPCECPDKYLGV